MPESPDRIEATADQIVIRDQTEMIRVVVGVRPEAPIACFYDAAGELAGGLTFGPNGSLIVTVLDSQGEPRASLLVHDGQTLVVSHADAPDPIHVDAASDVPAVFHNLFTQPN